jgi:hypothetical protein
MTTIKDAAAEFLSHKRVTVTGVSRTPGSHGSNAVCVPQRQSLSIAFQPITSSGIAGVTTNSPSRTS